MVMSTCLMLWPVIYLQSLQDVRSWLDFAIHSTPSTSLSVCPPHRARAGVPGLCSGQCPPTVSLCDRVYSVADEGRLGGKARPKVMQTSHESEDGWHLGIFRYLRPMLAWKMLPPARLAQPEYHMPSIEAEAAGMWSADVRKLLQNVCHRRSLGPIL